MAEGILPEVRDGLQEQAARVRSRIRARYPILRDGTLVSVDGRLGDGWFAKGLLQKELSRLWTPERSRERAAPSGPALQEILETVDRTLAPAVELPARLVLLAVAPRKAHACWRLSETALQEARLRLPQSTLVLRVYDVTWILFDGANAHGYRDIELPAATGRRSIEFGAADRSHLAEIGLRAGDGRFLPLVRSEAAILPRETAAAEAATLVNVRANTQPVLRPAVPELFRIHEPKLIIQPGEYDWPLRDLEAERRIRQIYREFLRDGSRALRLHGPTPRTPAPELRLGYEMRQLAKSAPAPQPAAKKPEPATPVAETVLFRLDPTVAPRPSLASSPSLPTVFRNGRTSLRDIGRAERAQEISRLAMLASKRPLTRVAPLALPGEAKLPTPTAPEAPTAKRKVSFKLNRVSQLAKTLTEAGVELEAELILRGRVKAGKKVRIGGRIIETQPDGTFCVSCIVRDGRLHVPVEVVEAEVVTARSDVSVDLGIG